MLEPLNVVRMLCPNVFVTTRTKLGILLFGVILFLGVSSIEAFVLCRPDPLRTCIYHHSPLYMCSEHWKGLALDDSSVASPDEEDGRYIPFESPRMSAPVSAPSAFTNTPLYQHLLQQNLSSVEEGEPDLRQALHPIFSDIQNKSEGDMDVVFVGTASCAPGTTRGVSCTVLKANWGVKNTKIDVQKPSKRESVGRTTWLFDCGEGTQRQIQRTKAVRPGRIDKIFLTHSHGDHSFGLPGVLCMIGPDRSTPVDIYGPEGLRMWLRVALRYSASRGAAKYRVHELKEVPMAPEWEWSPRTKRFSYMGWKYAEANPKGWKYHEVDPSTWLFTAETMKMENSSWYGEVEGGRDIYPVYNHTASYDGAPVWELENTDTARVFAAPMSHVVPCVGYVVEEHPKPGRLRDSLITPIVQRNLQGLKDAGYKIPMKTLAVVKNLPPGGNFTFPDGTVVLQEEATEPPVKGRKVCICGDTASARSLTKLALGADVLVHEATNTFLPDVDKNTTNIRRVSIEARRHGHSTPFMMGRVVRKIRPKKLLLTHFSARYMGDSSLESVSVMAKIEEQAMEASRLNLSQVAAAWDFMVFPVITR